MPGHAPYRGTEIKPVFSRRGSNTPSLLKPEQEEEKT